MTIFLVPGYVTEVDKFNSRSSESKSDYLLQLGNEGAERFLSENNVDPYDVADEVYEKIAALCSKECQYLQNENYNRIHAIVEESEILDKKSQRKRENAVKWLTRAATLTNELKGIYDMLTQFVHPDSHCTMKS